MPGAMNGRDYLREFFIATDNQARIIMDKMAEGGSLREYSNYFDVVGAWIGGACEEQRKLTADRILKSGNRVIVFWKDGTKTIVKLAEGEQDSIYAAFTAALAIKLYGSNSKLQKTIRKLTVYQK